jgi:hypothetical protein
MNMNLKKLPLAALLALLPLLSHAHTALTESTPAADATVYAVPEVIQLVFNGPVRLARLQVLHNGKTLVTDFQPASEAKDTYSIKPQSMDAGNFTVSWTAIGSDGHTVSNSFSFVVASAAGGAAC